MASKKPYYGISDVPNGKQVFFSVDKSEKDLHKILKTMNTKQLMLDCANIAVDEVDKYVPEGKTGNLKKYGKHITLANSKINPWFKLVYRNTTKVPYAMYQYQGKVWENNIPKLSNPAKTKTDNEGKTNSNHYRLKFLGWKSSKHKVPTNRDIGKPFSFPVYKYVWVDKIWAKDVKDKSKYRGKYGNWRRNTIGYDLKHNPEKRGHKNQYKRVIAGRVTIHGYSKKTSQPKWLEELDKNRTTFNNQDVPVYIAKIQEHIITESIKAIEGKK